MNANDIIDNVLKNGFYTDGNGNERKLPSSELDREFIFNAIRKRCRKAVKRLTEINKEK